MRELKAEDMIVYTKCDEYKILVDAKAHRFYVQMTGKELDSVAYDIAADAIVAAEGMK